ncbi:hypothetical protein WKI72_04790 [Candidatus Erwinia dacicola]|uniref:Uncharacterized protein n=1 Tax=Candidatus Erwinia dacicola TaxID=252393 RepID=A0A328TTG9_9GAMM|nr:hypothetical protein ACZ87_02146 [Candidatus Erwinia dacicola]
MTCCSKQRPHAKLHENRLWLLPGITLAQIGKLLLQAICRL